MSWPRIRAVLITLLLVWQGILALPMPNRVHRSTLRSPEGREEFDNWYGFLSGIGLPWSRDEAQRVLIRFTNQVNDAYAWMEAPGRPLQRLTRTGQSWMFFAVADTHPNRLEVWIRSDNHWQQVYVAGDPDFDELAPVLHFRRVRGIHDLLRKETPTYKRLVAWLAEQVFAAHPEATVMEVRQVRQHTVVPGETADDDRILDPPPGESSMTWLWTAWERLLDQREHPRTLALLRIGVGAMFLADYLHAWSLGLVVELFGTADFGGWAGTDRGWLFEILPATPGSAIAFHGALCLSALCLSLGLGTRVSAVVLLLLSAQSATLLPAADRGIDRLLRNLLVLLACSGAGRAWSVEAWLRGNWSANGVTIPAWPRYLAILQLVVMYFTAGIQKIGITWMPMGGFSALYILLQDPALARMDFAWLGRQPFYLFTQLGTAVTVIWQDLMPVVGLFYWYQATPERGGWLRSLCNRYHAHLWWMSVGVLFHIGIAATLRLGIFPWAMLVSYVVFFHPDELKQIFAKSR